MRRINYKKIFRIGVTAGLLAGLLAASVPHAARADVAITPSLVISQLKITSSSGQFITLYNSTNTTLDMQYPGTIKVNVIRETRAIEFAK